MSLNLKKLLDSLDSMGSENEIPKINIENKLVEPTSAIELLDEQIDAFNDIKQWLDKPKINLYNDEDCYKNIYLMSGPGGSGKTFITSHLVKGRMVTFSAPTHQATNVLTRNINNKDIVAVTLQSLLKLRVSPITSEALAGIFVANTMKKMLELMNLGLFYLPDILIIDEASLIDDNGFLDEKEYNEYDELIGSHVTAKNFVNPSLGTYLIELMKLKFKLYKKETKILLIGDIVQTPPVGSDNFGISTLLTKVIENGNVSYLSKIRRTNNETIKNMSLQLRDEFHKIYADNMHKPNLFKIFQDITPIRKEITYCNDKNIFIETFCRTYKHNLSTTINPNYTVIINFNRIGHNNTIADINKIRKRLFDCDQKTELNNGELILNTMPFEILDDKLEITVIGPDSKLIVESFSNIIIDVVLKNPKKKNIEAITIKNVPLIEALISVENPKNGEIIKRKVLFKGEELKSLIIQAFNDIRNTSVTTKLKFKNNKFLRGKDVFELNNMFPAFTYGYICNIYKIQGSTIDFPMVDLHNILNAPVCSLHKNCFTYTAISRTKIKPLIYHPSL